MEKKVLENNKPAGRVVYLNNYFKNNLTLSNKVEIS